MPSREGEQVKLIVIKAEMSDDEINEVVPSGTVTVEITSHHGAFIEMLRLDK